MKNAKVIVAHPYKHHAYFLTRGIQLACDDTYLVTPLYKKGIGRILPSIPGGIGRKASGYEYKNIKTENVYSPNIWQIKKLNSFIFGHEKIVMPFDKFVAEKINNGELNPKLLVTMQDYMPETIAAAKKIGAHIWSDQITNQSSTALSRISAHKLSAGVSDTSDGFYSEQINDGVLKIADTITVPSEYCRGGLDGRTSDGANINIVPYGADPSFFKSKNNFSEVPSKIIIVARANSVRKGGHIFLGALESCGDEIIELINGNRIEVKIIGKYASDMMFSLGKYKINNKISIEAKDYAHNEIPGLLAGASVFVMPALSESMSLVCVEAMHVGLPLIVTEYVGVDAIEDGVMGIICEDNVRSLANAIRSFFASPQAWVDMSEASAKASTRLTWENYENSIADIAKKII